MSTLATRLRALRLKLGLSQYELADITGVDRNTIAKAELGITLQPGKDKLRKLARILKTTPAQLEYGIVELPALDENLQLLTQRISKLTFSVRNQLIEDVNDIINQLEAQ